MYINDNILTVQHIIWFFYIILRYRKKTGFFFVT